MEVQVYAGIDVSKARLDLGLSGEPSVLSTGNDPRGIADLCERLGALKPARVVLEASGGL